MKRLAYLSIAEMELVDAAQFYDERQPGVGRLFLDAVREAGERIRQHPEWWPVVEAPIRACRVVPFPYRGHIQIVAVVHFSQRPGAWKDRLN